MSLSFDKSNPPAPGSIAAVAASQLLSSRGLSTPNRPQDSQPTLVGSPDNLDLHTADTLHIQACRWLEFVECEVAMAEAHSLITKNEAKWVAQRTKYKYGIKVDKWPESSLNAVEAAETSAVNAEATVVALRGVLSSLQKVKVAASRTITRHVKSDVSIGGGRSSWIKD